MSNNTVRGRDWTFIVYPDSAPANWRDLLDDQHVKWIESPLHDKDVDANGQLKKPHWHVLLSFDGPVTSKVVERVIKPLNGPVPQKVASARGMVRYFIHMDNPDKYQYDKSDIIGHCGADVNSYFTLNETDRLSVLKDIARFIYDNEIDNYIEFVMKCIQLSDDWFDIAVNKNTYAVDKMINSIRDKHDKE